MGIIANAKYKILTLPQHEQAGSQGKIYEHVLIAYKALGHRIPRGVHVHHIDNNPRNNKNTNLLICLGAYHRLIHVRTDAYDATGDANKMKCPYCKQYDDPANMYIRKNAYQAWHRICANNYKAVENPKTGPYKYNERTTITELK